MTSAPGRTLTLVRRALPLLAMALAPAVALADIVNESLQAGGMTFYLGIVPAEIVQGHPADHPERGMHKGASPGRSKYHVMVAIFDTKSGERVTDAQVKAHVETLNHVAGDEKALEPMTIANATTYGNFFDMSGKGAFRVELEVRRPGAPRPVDVEFQHAHR